MFTVEERDRVRERLLELAEADPGVAAAAITGSYAAGGGDEWSDIDLALAIDDEVPEALERWTSLLSEAFGVLHHWDLPRGSTIYRVFLLSGCLEVDIAFAPPAEFGPRGPNWRTVFGEAVELAPDAPPRRDDLVGLAWHHVLHARACIGRGKPWQAEYWISALRDQVLALACLRLGHTTWYAKGADLLPPELTASLKPTLVCSLDEAELRRALAAAAVALSAELERTDAALADRLRPLFRSPFARAGPVSARPEP
jgi:predicted nucleotidyltransferase